MEVDVGARWMSQRHPCVLARCRCALTRAWSRARWVWIGAECDILEHLLEATREGVACAAAASAHGRDGDGGGGKLDGKGWRSKGTGGQGWIQGIDNIQVQVQACCKGDSGCWCVQAATCERVGGIRCMALHSQFFHSHYVIDVHAQASGKQPAMMRQDE